MSIVKLLAIAIFANVLLGCASSPRTELRSLTAPPRAPIPHGTPVRLDPAHPVIVPYQYYPAASKLRGEQGSCIVKLTVGTDGRVQDAEIRISTSFKGLDEACLKALRFERFLPATQDGKPIISTIELPINWRL